MFVGFLLVVVAVIAGFAGLYPIEIGIAIAVLFPIGICIWHFWIMRYAFSEEHQLDQRIRQVTRFS